MPKTLRPRALFAFVTLAAAATATAPVAMAAGGDAGYVGPPHTLTTYDPSQPCLGSGPTPATGWCSYYTGATAGRPGQNVDLSTAVCRLPGLPDAALVAGDGEQADFAVGVNSEPAAWTWSQDKTFAAAETSVDVPAGRCVQWSVPWSVVDDLGRPLAPGSYYLSATPLVEPTDLPATMSAFTPQTFTVR